MMQPVQIRPTPQGTIVILIACGVGYLMSFQDAASSRMAQLVAIALLLGITISFLIDWRKGLKNLIRVDVFALLSFYFLTFFEFLFPQTRFDILSNPDDVVIATHLFIIGLAAMVIGRHLDVFPKNTIHHIGVIEMQPRDFLLIFFGAAFLNFLPMLMAVDFNPIAWFEETLRPRFERAWGRGKYGNLSTLLNELQLLGYVLPPVAGVIFARRKQYSMITLILTGLIILLLWYSAFSSGTRNILAIQVVGLFAGFFLVQRQLRLKYLIPAAVAVGVSYFYLADMMLDFRQMGLGRYIDEGYYTSQYKDFEEEYLADSEDESGYFVDYNLWRMSQIVGVFPDLYDFIGWNMPFVALTKPIPRAFWPGKPEDLKVGLEEAIGAVGYTIAVTWVGEAYISGGIIWIVGIGLLIGAFCCYWNGLANYVQHTFPLIVFASGFYAVLLLMRSLMFFTTALLPSIALIVMGMIIYKQRQPY